MAYHCLGTNMALKPAWPTQPLKAELTNADRKSLRYVCTSCIMHKLLTRLLTAVKAAAKAGCKQLPIVERATRGKQPENRDSSLRLNPIVTPCKLNSKLTEESHCSKADTTWIQTNCSARPPYQFSLLEQKFSRFARVPLIFFEKFKATPSLSMNKA